MEDNNLKECWKEIHTGTEIKPMNIKEVIRKKHCRVISQTLRRQKTLISLFAILLAFSVAASIWDTIIMGSASISLWAGSAFLLFLLIPHEPWNGKKDARKEHQNECKPF